MRKLRTHLLLVVAGGLFVGAAVSLIVSSVLVNVSHSSWTETSTAHMVDAEVDNLKRLAAEKSEYSDEILEAVAANTRTIARMNDRLLAELLEGSTPQPTYSLLLTSPSSGSVPGFGSEEAGVSYDVSGWWACSASPSYKGDCSGVSSISALESRSQATLESQRLSDVLHRAQHQSGITVPPGGVKGMGVEYDGTAPFYPWTQSSSFADSVVTCDFDNLANTKRGYDPRCRPWYNGASDLAPGAIAFSPPYVFAGSQPGLGVTASSPNRHPTSGSLQGVTLLDFSISKIENSAVNAPIGQGNGYGFVLAADGSVVAHPRIDRDKTAAENNITILEFGSDTVTSEVQAFMDNVVSPMLAGASGDTTYTKDGSTFYVAFGPVPVSNYSLALTIPESDIKKPATDAEDEVNSFVIIIVIICVLGIVAVFVAALKIAAILVRGIVRPVDELIRVTHAINTNNYSTEMIKVDTPIEELADLQDIFRLMYESVRVGNLKLETGNLDQALATYARSRETFQKMGHTKIVGLCDNNSGVAYTRLNQPAKASACFALAVQATELRITQLAPADTEYVPHLIQLANRLMNLARANLAVGTPDKLREAASGLDRASQLLHGKPEASFALFRALVLKAEVVDTLATVSSGTGSPRLSAAVLPAPLQEAIELRNFHGAEFGRPGGELDQMLSLAVAKHYAAAKDTPAAISQLGLTLEMGQTQDKATTDTAWNLLSNLGGFGDAGGLDVVLLIDVSGSMSINYGSRTTTRLDAAKDNVVSSFDTMMNAGDTVSLYSFSHVLTKVLKLVTVDDGGEARRQLLAATSRLDSDGATLLYTSIMESLKDLETDRSMRYGAAKPGTMGRQAWLVVLTDGEDSGSETGAGVLRKKLADLWAADPAYGVIIIGLGIKRGTAQVLKSVATATPKGIYIAAGTEDRATLDQAFRKAVTHVQQQMTLEEM